MVKILINLDEEQNMKVGMYKLIHSLKTKQEAIKKIIDKLKVKWK